ncbi:MAG: hypothetical protein HFH49_00735 [Lachnospiraceae bacterium]|nr:hypothetical protein [Lachnospiraceae bacterium]
MKKILDFLPLLVMLIVMIILFTAYDVAHIKTELILTGTMEFPFWIRASLVGLFLSAMLCIPVICLAMNEHRITSFLYCAIVLLGTIWGKERFWELILLGFCFFGIFFGSVAEIAMWIIKLFFHGFNGTWICVIAQVAGHIFTVCMLCFLPETLEESANSGSVSKESHSSNCRKEIDYFDEVRQMREKEQLETLKRIERDLRYK